MSIKKSIFTLVIPALFAVGISAEQPPGFEKPQIQAVFSFAINGYDKNAPFNSPVAFCIDEKNNELLVADTGNNAIGIFSADTGEYKGRLDTAVQLRSPCGIAIDDEGGIYVACSDSSTIDIFDFKGARIDGIDLSIYRQKMPVKPGKLYWNASAAELFVIDRANQQLLIYKDKKFYAKIQPFPADTVDSADWKKTPMLQDVVVDAHGKIYVISSIGNAVTVLDSKGNILKSFGRHGDTANMVSFPVAVSIDKKNRLWIIDNFRHCVTVFDAQGVYLATCGAYGTAQGDLFFPADIIIKDNALFVLEKGAERVQVFTIKE